jgi:hypothetical protein
MTPDQIFEQLKALASLTGAVAWIPAIIVFVLNRKGANRRINIEQTTAGATVFDVQTKAYQDLLDRLQNSEDILTSRLDDADTRFDLLRALFLSVVSSRSIELTKEEQEQFEATKHPRKPSPRKRA